MNVFLLITLLSFSPVNVDWILVNGKIYTVDEEFSLASAMAIDNGKIVAIGSNEEVMKSYRSQNITDLLGKTVIPGFNDGHCHFLNYGITRMYADLTGLNSFDDVLSTISKHDTASTGGWILGRGWDQNLWEGNEFPNCKALDSLYPDIPVYLVRVDGHAALANNAALKLAGISNHTKIPGGVVVTVGDRCTGILIDNAMEPVRKILPTKESSFMANALLTAQQACFSYGLTSVQDAGLDKDQIEVIRQLKQQGLLPMRMNIMLTPDKSTLETFLPKGPLVEDDLVIRSVKIYADGALGSRGAALIEPYEDDSANNGLLFYSTDSLMELLNLCKQSGFQACSHAIGDRANRQILNAYSKVLDTNNNDRWRVEHCQIVHPDDIYMYGKYNIIPSVQTTHATSDMLWAPLRLGEERTKSAYSYQSLLEQNGYIVNGTDFPVEPINPLLSFVTAISRKSPNAMDAAPFLPEQSLSKIDAFRSITSWPAYASFEENVKGSLEVGKFADFVILDQDLLSITLPDVKEIKVLATILNGTYVYQSENGSND